MSVKTLAKNDESLKSVLQGTALFTDLSEEEIQSCLVCSKAESIIYEKGEMIKWLLWNVVSFPTPSG